MKRAPTVAIILVAALAWWAASQIQRVEYRDFAPKRIVLDSHTLRLGLEGEFDARSAFTRSGPYRLGLMFDDIDPKMSRTLRVNDALLRFERPHRTVRLPPPERILLSNPDGTRSVLFLFPKATIAYENCVVTATLVRDGATPAGHRIEVELETAHRFEWIFLPYEWMLSA